MADTVDFTVTPFGSSGANAKIIAVKVQDIIKDLWFTYSGGAWDKTPAVSSGTNNVYVAVYVTNTGSSAGAVTIGLDSAVATKGSQFPSVAAGQSVALEWTGTITSKTAFTLSVQTDSVATDSVSFNVSVGGGTTGDKNWLIIAVLGIGAVAVAGGALYASGSKKKQAQAVEV